MPLTQRMGLPVPEVDQDPWYEAFLSFANALDGGLFSGREDRNVFLKGGGTFTFDGSTGLVTWSSTIQATAGIAGFLWEVSADSISLQDGEYLFIDVVRAPTSNKFLPPQHGFQLPSSDTAFAIAFRSGSTLYFRNGRALNAGSSLPVLDSETGSGGGSGGFIAMATDAVTDQSSYVLVGGFTLDASTVSSVRFKTVASVSGGGLTGNVQLFNLTDATQVIVHSHTGTTPNEVVSIPLVLPSGTKVYEVRIRVLGGTPPTDIVTALWAGLVLA